MLLALVVVDVPVVCAVAVVLFTVSIELASAFTAVPTIILAAHVLVAVDIARWEQQCHGALAGYGGYERPHHL